MSKCLILSAVPVKKSETLEKYIKGCDFVIAADGGYKNAEILDVKPDILIGDFDSLEYRDYGMETIRLPVMKDDTDTVSAIKLAYNKGFKELVIMGGIGGKRLDHTIANIVAVVYARELGMHAVLVDEYNVVSVVKNERRFYDKDCFKYLSVFPFGGDASGVTLKGVKYPLNDYNMRCMFPLGVSNEITEKRAEIIVNDGVLVIIRSDFHLTNFQI